MSVNFEQLEAQLKTLGENKGILTTSKKQAIRDRVFQSIGQIELADAIATGETKAGLAVSLKHLQQALIPHRLSFSMPATVAVVMVVFLGSLVTGAAAQSSKPGDVLFNVKKVLENLELAVVANPIRKAEMSLGIAGQRLKYLEESVGKEGALQVVLKETQSALVSARATVKKAKGSGDEQQATALLEKFNSLLADQKIILDDIEKTKPSEDVQQTIVAIRDVIEGKTGTEASQTPGQVNQNTPPASSTGAKPVAKPVVSPNPNQPPTLATTSEGFQTLVGRLGTVSGQPALYVGGNQYLVIMSSPVSLQEYIGANSVALSGTVKSGGMVVYRIVINGNVLVDIPFTFTNPVSTDGNVTEIEKPANQE